MSSNDDLSKTNTKKDGASIVADRRAKRAEKISTASPATTPGVQAVSSTGDVVMTMTDGPMTPGPPAQISVPGAVSSNLKTHEDDRVAIKINKQTEEKTKVVPGAVRAVNERRSKSASATVATFSNNHEEESLKNSYVNSEDMIKKSVDSNDIEATKKYSGERATVPGAVHATKERRSKAIDNVPVVTTATAISLKVDIVATKQPTGERAIVPGNVYVVEEQNSEATGGDSGASPSSQSNIVATKQSIGEHAIIPGAVSTVEQRRTKTIADTTSAQSDFAVGKQSTGDRVVLPGAVPTARERRSKSVVSNVVSAPMSSTIDSEQRAKVNENGPGAIAEMGEKGSMKTFVTGLEPKSKVMASAGTSMVAGQDLEKLKGKQGGDNEDEVEPDSEIIGVEPYDDITSSVMPNISLPSTAIDDPKVTPTLVASAETTTAPVIYDPFGNVINDIHKKEEYNVPIAYADETDALHMQVILGNEDIIIEQYEDEKDVQKRVTKKAIILGATAIVLAAIIGIVLALVVFVSDSEKSDAPSSAPSFAPTASAFPEVVSVVTAFGVSSMDVFADPNSPQYKAARFLSDEDPYSISNELFSDTSNPSLSAQIIQRYILSVLYFSTGGDSYWKDCNRGAASCIVGGKESYLSDSSECDWVGSTCKEGNIIRISFVAEIQSTGVSVPMLNGTLPTELSYLSSLEELHIENDVIGGTIPTEFGLLTNLKELRLSKQQLDGRIPQELSQLVNLELMYIRNNFLDERFFTSTWSNLTNLKELDLFNNKIPGKIPNEFSKMESLEILNLAGNKLVGSIPADLLHISGLKEVQFVSNKLTGFLPANITSINLKKFSVGDNSMKGSIPDALYDLTNLEYLRLDSNSFTGTLSQLIGTLPLELLILNDNSLSGTVPTEIGSLSGLTHLYLDNGFSGSVPDEICLLNLQELLVDCGGLSCSCCTGECMK